MPTKRRQQQRKRRQRRPNPWKVTSQGKARWRARVYVGKQPGRRSPLLEKTFDKQSEAKEWKRSMETARVKKTVPRRDSRTVAAFMEDWLVRHAQGRVLGKTKRNKQRKPRSRTVSDYRETVNRWILEPPKALTYTIGQRKLSDVDDDVLDKFYTAMLKLTTAGVVRRLHNLLAYALEDATRKRVLVRNPTDLATPPAEDDDASERLVMDQQQLARFLGAARKLFDARTDNGEPLDRYSALWHVLALGGLRPGEALGLKWSDVDLEAGSVRVQRALVHARQTKGWTLESPKTPGSRRTVPLPGVAVEELKKWKRQQAKDRLAAGAAWQNHNLVFTTALGTPLPGARRSFTRVCEAAGLGEYGEQPKRRGRNGPMPKRPFKPAFTIYSLRHACATMLLLAGESLKVVSERLGHTSINLTADTYSHVLPSMQQEAAEKLERMFGTV